MVKHNPVQVFFYFLGSVMALLLVAAVWFTVTIFLSSMLVKYLDMQFDNAMLFMVLLNILISINDVIRKIK